MDWKQEKMQEIEASISKLPRAGSKSILQAQLIVLQKLCNVLVPGNHLTTTEWEALKLRITAAVESNPNYPHEQATRR